MVADGSAEAVSLKDVKDGDIPFIRADLNQTDSKNVTTWFRLDSKLRDFLNLCLEKHGEFDAVVLTKENGTYHWNIGFSLPPPKSNE